jgi:GTPase SAR1 family protein
MSYPPKYILEEGEKEVSRFLTVFYPDDMETVCETVCILVGNQFAGKTFLGLSLAEDKPKARDVQPENRTEGVDIYNQQLKDYIVKIFDIGGQQVYRLM